MIKRAQLPALSEESMDFPYLTGPSFSGGIMGLTVLELAVE